MLRPRRIAPYICRTTYCALPPFAAPTCFESAPTPPPPGLHPDRYYEVELLKIAKAGAATVGWALGKYFGDAYSFEGVGSDRHSWGYSSHSTANAKWGTLRHSAQKACHASKKRGADVVNLSAARFGRWLVGDIAWLDRDDGAGWRVVSVTHDDIVSFGESPASMRRHFSLNDPVQYRAAPNARRGQVHRGGASPSAPAAPSAPLAPRASSLASGGGAPLGASLGGSLDASATVESGHRVVSKEASHDGTVEVAKVAGFGNMNPTPQTLQHHELQHEYRLHDIVVVIDPSVKSSPFAYGEPAGQTGCIVDVFFAVKLDGSSREEYVTKHKTTHVFEFKAGGSEPRKLFKVVLEDGSVINANASALKRLSPKASDLDWKQGDVIGTSVDVEQRLATFYHLRSLPTFKPNIRNIDHVSELPKLKPSSAGNALSEVYVEVKNVPEHNTGAAGGRAGGHVGVGFSGASSMGAGTTAGAGAEKKTFRWGALNGPDAIDAAANTAECLFFNSTELSTSAGAAHVAISATAEPTNGKLELLVTKSFSDKAKNVTVAVGTSVTLKLDGKWRFHQLGLLTKDMSDVSAKKVSVLSDANAVVATCNLEKGGPTEAEVVLLSPDKLKDCRTLTVRVDACHGAENGTVELIGFKILGRIEDMDALCAVAASAPQPAQATTPSPAKTTGRKGKGRGGGFGGGFDFKAAAAERMMKEAMPQIEKVTASQIRRNFSKGDNVTIPGDAHRCARVLRLDDQGKFELEVFTDSARTHVAEKRTLTREELSTDPTEHKFRPVISVDMPVELDSGQTLKPVLSLHKEVGYSHLPTYLPTSRRATRDGLAVGVACLVWGLLVCERGQLRS